MGGEKMHIQQLLSVTVRTGKPFPVPHQHITGNKPVCFDILVFIHKSSEIYLIITPSAHVIFHNYWEPNHQKTSVD